jgi:hypothetical protein
MPLVPHRFLLRIAHPCRHVKDMPRAERGQLLDLPAECRVDNFAAMDGQSNFADISLAWNELGLGLVVEVHGKERAPQGDAARPRGSDGTTLWLDTRGARGSHRASRYCHQFHFLAAGGGPDREDPAFVQTNINRALEDAPHVATAEVAMLVRPIRGGYRLEAFLPAAALHGYDPEQHSRLGFFYAVRDDERGEQLLSGTAEFPFWEDPSLWGVLALVR